MRGVHLGLIPFLLGVVVPGPQDPVRDAAMLQRAQQLAEPAEPHRLLAKLAGAWDVVWQTTLPDGTRQEDRGTAEGEVMLGGRYVRLRFRLQIQGREVHAEQILGFDTLHQVHTSSWRDDLSTWSVECSGAPVVGPADQLRLFGTLADVRDPAGRPFRLEWDLAAKDTVQVRAFETRGADEVEVQAQRWTRR
jgi:hypothetical protein